MKALRELWFAFCRLKARSASAVGTIRPELVSPLVIRKFANGVQRLSKRLNRLSPRVNGLHYLKPMNAGVKETKLNSSARARVGWRLGYLLGSFGIYMVDQSSKAWA